MQELITFFAANGIAQYNLNSMHIFVNKQRNWNDKKTIILHICLLIKHEYISI